MTKRPRPTLVPTPAWRDLLATNANGNPVPDLANVLVILRNVHECGVAFAFDEMQQASILRAPTPLGGEGTFPRLVTENDVSIMQEWLQRLGLRRLGREHVFHAIEQFARETPIHPLRLWLRTRDLTARQPILENWLTPALGCPNDAYHRQIGQMFIVAMVARVFEPGCQADYMLVLEGPQGGLKSQFCRMLAGDEYFSDHLPDLHNDPVRLSMHLRGLWLGEISELAAFRGAQTETLKAFITRRVEIYTPKFHRKEVREPRQCLFIGTTNVDDWIKDETGGRRFWPVRVERVDLDWLQDHREQLFAEAVQAYEADAPWFPTPDFERRVIAPRQEKATYRDAWEDILLPELEWRASITLLDAAQVLGIASDRFSMLEQKRIAAILRKNKWSKGQDSKGRNLWRKPE